MSVYRSPRFRSDPDYRAGRVGHRWRMVRRAVLERDGLVCQVRLPGCLGFATCVDHIVPLAVDSSRAQDMSNLRAACRHCNGKRNSKTATVRRASAIPW